MVFELIATGVGALFFGWGARSYLTDDSSDSEGCNGHHWGEPYKLWNVRGGDNRAQYVDVGMFGGTVNDPCVCVEETQKRKCQDCGEAECVDEEVARMRLSDFEEAANN